MIWNPWREIKRLRAELAYQRIVANDCSYYARHLVNAGEALEAIASQEKPTSNATVKRMARIAREALEQ